jgi:two-component system chemotaxis sensor kinase CheA
MENTVVENCSDEVMNDFIMETGDLINQAYEDLLDVSSEKEWEEKIGRLYRTFHTIKGTSSFLNIEKCTLLAHVIETLINRVRKSKSKPDKEIIDIFFNVVEWYKNFIDALANKMDYNDDISGLIDRIEQFSTTEKTEAPENGLIIQDNSFLTTEETNRKKGIDTFRIGINELDTISNLSSDLLLEKNKLLSLIRQFQRESSHPSETQILEDLYISLGYISTEIQEIITQTRMYPIARLFRKYTRYVQVLSRMRNKSIRLHIGDGNPNVDRCLTDIIDDILIHLIRNAVDHGIETSELRRKMGKSATGTIKISAYRNGNHVNLVFEDDGAGFNYDTILKKAMRDGIVTKAEAARLGKKEIINLIFKPGFTTSPELSEISGRGIGMEVVQANIRKLNGTIDISSRQHIGTNISITFPVTLKILSGLTLKESGEYFIIPSFSFYDMLKLSKCRIEKIDRRTYFSYEDSPLPLYYLRELLDIPVSGEQTDEKYIIILAAAEKRVGLVVSDIFFQEETVVKTSGNRSERTPFLTGTTIRNNGQVALILDIQRLMDFSEQRELVN